MDYLELHTHDALASYLKNLERNIICLDIEGDYNLYQYGEKVCLIQIYDGRQLVIIDPFKFENRALAKIFEKPRLLKVMYGAASDLSVLKNGHEIECKSVLDLQPGVKLLGYKKLNLYAALHACLGIELHRKKAFQKYNWTKRPVDEDAITYALLDVRYLFDLKELLMRKLGEEGLLEQFFLHNMILQQKDYTRSPGQSIRKSNRFQTFSSREKQRFEAVFAIREKYAKRLNIPPHRLLGNHDLLDIASTPGLFHHTAMPKNMPRHIIKAFHQELQGLFQGR